jgi:hypothetical protein
MTTPTQGEHAQTALEDFEVRKLAAIGAVSTSSGLVERRPIEYRRELENQFVRGYRAAESRLHAQVAALTAAPGVQANTRALENIALLADILNRRPAMNAGLVDAYAHWTAEVYDLMGAMAAEPANDAAPAQPADGAAHVQKSAKNEHVAGDVSKNGAESNMGVAYAELPEQVGWRDSTYHCDLYYDPPYRDGLAPLFTADQMRDFADATYALRASREQAPATQQAGEFDEQGFRDWLMRNMPDDTIIGSSAWWADHLTAWAKRFVKAAPQPSPTAQAAPAAQYPIAPDVAADLERSDWTPEEALRWYAAGKHYDTVPNGDGSSSARILDNGAVASNALKSLSRDYAEHKGDVALMAAPAATPVRVEKDRLPSWSVESHMDAISEPAHQHAQEKRVVEVRRAAPVAGAVAGPDGIDAIALTRYKVVPSHDSMFHRFAVVAGDGKQQLYLGRETECQNMARKFAGAFLDGAFYQSQIAAAPTPAAQADSVLEDAAPQDEHQLRDIALQTAWSYSSELDAPKYLPRSTLEASVWKPHRWVILAMKKAIEADRTARKQGAKHD